MPKPSVVRFDSRAVLEPWPDFPDAEVCAGDRSHRGHRWIDDKAHGLGAGVWEAEANLGRWTDWPVHEFVLVLDGEVVMVEADRETVFGPGAAFVIPKGCRCIWNQCGYLKKFMVIFDNPAPVAAPRDTRIVAVDTAGPLAPSTPPAPAMLLSPVPVQHARDCYTDPSGRFSVGVWDTTGYHRKLIDFPRHELMHLLEGSVTLTDDAGRSQTFNAGDTFFVPLGAPNSWKSEGYLRKIYCILQPKP